MIVDLLKLTDDQLTDWYKELLRRGWVWIIEETKLMEKHEDERRS